MFERGCSERSEFSNDQSALLSKKDSAWEPLQRRNRRRGNGFPLVDISDNSPSVALSDDSQSVALSDNRLSESEVEPLSSALELASLERERKTLCYSPTKSCVERVRTPDFLGNHILENWECPSRHPSLEVKEEQNPLASEPWSFPSKSHHHSPSGSLLKEEGIPGSPLPGIPEPAWIPQTPKIEQATPGSPGIVTVTSISNETPASSPAPSRLGFERDNTLRDTEARARHLSVERRLGDTEQEKSTEAGDLADGCSDYPEATSPWSPYYCPSEIDSRLYSDSSSMHDSRDFADVYSPAPPLSPPTIPQFQNLGLHQQDLACRALPPHALTKAPVLSDRKPSSPPSAGAPPPSPGPDQSPPLLSPTHRPRVSLVSPMVSTNDSLVSFLSSVSPLPFFSSGELEGDASCSNPAAESSAESSEHRDSEGEEISESEAESGHREANHKDRQYVSQTQLNRLKSLMGRPLPDLGADDRPDTVDDGDDEEEEDSGPAQLMCRHGLSLVYSSMEERCHASTLQLLSDFLHPRHYPPADVMSHLIRGILLGPDTPPAIVLQAYSLLMRIQKNHPATASTVQWDWDLLISAMDRRGVARGSALCLFMQYIQQTLEDDFHLGLQMLQGSIAKATLSCSKSMMHVRDVINWLVATVTSWTGDPEGQGCETETEKQKERDENLKMVLVLQKMLVLAMEVDCFPTTSSNKIAEYLLQILISSSLHRCHRLLFLQTLESSLLQCKLLELLLQHICTVKTELPMSLSLILHFLRNATLQPDPTDGVGSWRRWRELLQLLWMLVLSYEKVVDGHLRRPISQRAKCSHAPSWTTNDDITRAELLEATECFLYRVSADIGHAPPPQVKELLTYLQDHLLCFCGH